MITATGQDFDGSFQELANHLHSAPMVSPRGQQTRELIMASLKIAQPERCILQNPARKISCRYIQKEIDWYLSGTKSVEQIADHARMWSEVADADGTVNSAYGWQLFVQKTPIGLTQFEDAVSTLVEDPYSRRAVLNIHQVFHKYETKDVPCTIALQFLVRNSRLHLLVISRSTDFIWGLGNDIPFFVFVQCMLSNALCKRGLSQSLGSYSHVFGSLHVYGRHFQMLERICETKTEYRSAPLISVLSEHARNALREGSPRISQNTHDTEMPLKNKIKENWRQTVKKKIARIRRKEDPNIYPLY